MSISAMKYALDVLDNYVEDPRCETHRVTAVNFLRQAIAEAEKQLVHASDISQERVDETAKSKHEPLEQCSYPKCQATNGCVGVCSKGQPDLARVGEVGVWGDKREWVGLDDDIPGLGLVTEEFYNGMLCAEDILRRKNT